MKYLMPSLEMNESYAWRELPHLAEVPDAVATTASGRAVILLTFHEMSKSSVWRELPGVVVLLGSTWTSEFLDTAASAASGTVAFPCAYYGHAASNLFSTYHSVLAGKHQKEYHRLS